MRIRILLSVFVLLAAIQLNAQDKGFFYHKVMKGETIQYVASLYEVEIDSIIYWNELSNDIIFKFQLLQIPLKYALEGEELIERLNYQINSLNQQKKSNEAWLNAWVEETRKKNFEVDMSNPSAIQVVFERAQQKSLLQDSINNENGLLDKEIQLLTRNLNIETEKIATAERAKLEQDSINAYRENLLVVEEVEEIKESAKKSKQPKEKPTDPAKRVAYSNSDTANVIVIDDSAVKEKTVKEKTVKEKPEKLPAQKDSVFTTINIKEVEIKSTKNTKPKFGDQVDKTSQDKAKFYLSRAKSEIDKENTKKAFAYVEKSLTINPSYVEAFMLKGDLYASMQYFDAALEQYYKAQLLDKTRPVVHYNIGICLNQLARKKDALVAMNEAVRLDSTFLLAIFGRSSMLLDLNKYDQAIDDFDRILAINKFYYPAHKGKGIALLKKGAYSEAVEELNKVLPFDAEDPVVYYHRGLAWLYKDELYDACVDFLKASQLGNDEAMKAMKKYCE